VDKVELSLKSETTIVSYVIQKLEDFCRQHQLTDDNIENITIACDEALTNIIMHAYDGKKDGKILVCFNISQNAITIELTDFGKKFKPGKIEKKQKFKLDQWEIGGFGLILMNEFMDELRFSHDEKGKMNKLIMRKYFE
jgi:anti-sigma regulatory factor (Ser/Thr protein kinase)